MIIIVEGIDRIGKSTYANILHKHFNFNIHKHAGIVPLSTIDNLNATDKMLELIEIVNETKCDLIFDRFHLTDYVYGIVERNYDKQLALQHFDLIESKIDKKNCVLVVIQPTDIHRSSTEHGKDLSQHCKLFKDIFNHSSLTKFTYTYDDFSNEQKIVEDIHNVLQERGVD